VNRSAVEGSGFKNRRVVEEIPVVVEAKIRPRRPGSVLHELELGNFPAKLYGVAVKHLGRNILEVDRPLVEDAAGDSAQILGARIGRSDIVAVTVIADVGRLRQTQRNIRVVLQFVPAPAGPVHPHFVQQRRREGVVPKRGFGLVHGIMAERVGRTIAVVRELGHRNFIDIEGNQVLAGGIEVQTPVELLVRLSVRAGNVVTCNIGNVCQIAGTAGTVATQAN